MEPVPEFVEACSATMALIGRVYMGALPREDYYAAWDKLADPDAYQPSEKVRLWMHSNWRAAVGESAPQAATVLPVDVLAGSEVNPTTPTITHTREVWEDWMPAFFTAFVTTGGNISKSAKASGINRDTFYEHRNNNPLFLAAYKEAKEEADDRLRAALDDRGVVGWEEPVYGRVGKDEDGVIGTQWKYDSQILRLLAAVHLAEVRAAKEASGSGTTVNVSTSATASASATAVSAPAKLKSLQQGKRKQLEKAARRNLSARKEQS